MSAKYQTADPFASDAFKSLEEFIKERSEAPVNGDENFEQFERDLHQRVMAFEAEVTARQLRRYDLEVEEVEVFGEIFRRKESFEKQYCGLSGTMTVDRTLYVPRRGIGKSIVPLDLRAGIVEGTWTPLAARVMARTVASTTPKEAAEIFEEFGGMTPSTSSLDRIPKKLSEMWEIQREAFEEELRSREQVPAEAASIAVSIDGILIPMKDKAEVKEETPDEKKSQGPADYQEAGCGTVTYYDEEGERIGTTRYARMPEQKKVVLKGQLEDELRSILAVRPDLTVVGLADAAPDNWEFLYGLRDRLEIEDFREVVDNFHVLERIMKALNAYHGEGTAAAKIAFQECRTWLREEEDGADRVIRALRYRRDRSRGAKRKTIVVQIKYLENRKRNGHLSYKELLDDNLPIGSGVVEAACKTLVAQRMKCSGMSWREGQGILTLRSLIQSDRWRGGWELLSGLYRAEVKIITHDKVAA